MWPPYSVLTRFAWTTIATAFQRISDSMRRSSARSPGYGFSRETWIVLT